MNMSFAKGLCKILPSSVYWNYEDKNYEGSGAIRSSYRSLLPIQRPLGVPLATARAGFEIGQTESFEMRLRIERACGSKLHCLNNSFQDVSYLEQNGWYTSITHYFWISGKHYSGDVKGLTTHS